jgi:hypothetical protein
MPYHGTYKVNYVEMVVDLHALLIQEIPYALYQVPLVVTSCKNNNTIWKQDPGTDGSCLSS